MYASGNGSIAKKLWNYQLNANNTTGMYLTDKAVGHNYGTITNAAGVKDVTGVVVKNGAKFINEDSKEILAKFAQILDRDLDAKGYEELTNKFLEQNGLKLKDLAQALRIALTGSSVSPSIFEVLEVVGSNEIKNRIQNLLKEEK